jgi:alanine racemase
MTEAVLPPKWAFPEQKTFSPPGVYGISELSLRDEKRKTGVERTTHALVDLGAIADNISEIRKRIGEKRDLMAVVKADGYGHGAVEVSQTALKHGANCLGVATPEEGQQLREAGIDVPILVLGLIQPEEAYKVADFGLEQTICSFDLAEELNQIAANTGTRINIHIKLDTGMGRVGLVPKEALAYIRRVSRFKNLNLKGIFSHFSCADEFDKTFARKQIEIFERLIRDIEASGIKIPKKHIANSAAILDLPESYFDLVRPGIMIYGLYPSNEVSRTFELRPAMTLVTKVIFVKQVPPGCPISYGRAFITQKETTVATLPVGYADGYNRLLSGQGEVLIKGRRVPLMGRICMDMCMVDVSGIKDVRVGDEVILFGQGLSVDEIASKIGTINYEVVCGIGKRVPRIYSDE